MASRKPEPFHCESLAELARQVSFFPLEHRHAVLDRAEKLHDEVLADPDGTLPRAYLVWRIMGKQVFPGEHELIFNRATAHDVRLIIDQVSAKLDVVSSEPAYTTAELARRLHVATRTIIRWRREGLRWRWGRQKAGGRRQVLFTESAIETFRAAQGDRLQWAAHFSHLTHADHLALLARARRLAEASGASPFRIARHLARKTGRTTEALRLILLRHDREDPNNPIFRDYSAPLSEAQKHEILVLRRAGASVRDLTEQFQRTRTSIYRTLHEQRWRELLPTRPGIIHTSPTFDRPDAAAVFLAQPLHDLLPGFHPDGPAELPEPIRKWFAMKRGIPERERRLVTRWQFLQHRLAKVLDSAQHLQPRAAHVEQGMAAVEEASLARSAVYLMAMPITHSVAQRQLPARMPAGAPPRSEAILRLLSVFMSTIEEAITTFDPFGDKVAFEGYLTNRLQQRYAHLQRDPARDADRQPHDELIARLARQLETWIPTADLKKLRHETVET